MCEFCTRTVGIYNAFALEYLIGIAYLCCTRHCCMGHLYVAPSQTCSQCLFVIITEVQCHLCHAWPSTCSLLSVCGSCSVLARSHCFRESRRTSAAAPPSGGWRSGHRCAAGPGCLGEVVAHNPACRAPWGAGTPCTGGWSLAGNEHWVNSRTATDMWRAASSPRRLSKSGRWSRGCCSWDWVHGGPAADASWLETGDRCEWVCSPWNSDRWSSGAGHPAAGVADPSGCSSWSWVSVGILVWWAPCSSWMLCPGSPARPSSQAYSVPQGGAMLPRLPGMMLPCHHLVTVWCPQTQNVWFSGNQTNKQCWSIGIFWQF